MTYDVPLFAVTGPLLVVSLKHILAGLNIKQCIGPSWQSLLPVLGFVLFFHNIPC